MDLDSECKPRLRSVEAFGIDDGEGDTVGVRDPSGLCEVVLTVSTAALHILALMDGSRTCSEIRRDFHARFGHVLSQRTLQSMIDNLDRAHFLEGAGFDAHYESLLDAYRERPARTMPHADALGIDETGEVFERMLAAESPVVDGSVCGVIAPHLDYPRGSVAYAAAYSTLRDRPSPGRVIVLGTNHFGRSASVVATAQDFETPLGTTRVDLDFLQRLERRCGSLRAYELDHAREHSVELQVAWLQHLFGSGGFSILPLLCPDPCGPTGTRPRDGTGVDLCEFAEALGEMIAADSMDTLLVAGADLSHVGRAFGDDRDLDDAFLEHVRGRDRAALEALEAEGANSFLRALTEHDNDTRVCSAGCIFAIAHALRGATATVLRYHQAVDRATHACVTCAAVTFT